MITNFLVFRAFLTRVQCHQIHLQTLQQYWWSELNCLILVVLTELTSKELAVFVYPAKFVHKPFLYFVIALDPFNQKVIDQRKPCDQSCSAHM